MNDWEKIVIMPEESMIDQQTSDYYFYDWCKEFVEFKLFYRWIVMFLKSEIGIL